MKGPIVPPVGPRYFRSFASYDMPFRPVGPVAFPETEGWASFYSAYHDQKGRVVRFDKLRLVRIEKDARTFALATPHEANTPVYFEHVLDKDDGTATLGERINYAEIEGRDEFHLGVVGPSGLEGTASWLRMESAFTDVYAYWPSGRVRERRLHAIDREPTLEFHDAKGRPVAQRVPFIWEDVIAPGVSAWGAGAFSAARGPFETALRAAQSEESLRGTATALHWVAKSNVHENEIKGALEACRLALPFWEALDDPGGAAASWSVFGAASRLKARAAVVQGEFEAARRHYDAARDGFQKAAGLALRHGDDEAARDALEAIVHVTERLSGLSQGLDSEEGPLAILRREADSLRAAQATKTAAPV